MMMVLSICRRAGNEWTALQECSRGLPHSSVVLADEGRNVASG